MKWIEELILITIWENTWVLNGRSHKPYKIEGNRVKIKSTEIAQKLDLTYEQIKPVLMELKKRKFITGYIPEFNRGEKEEVAGWYCTAHGAKGMSYTIEMYKEKGIDLKQKVKEEMIKNG
jgi:hypothetical protein